MQRTQQVHVNKDKVFYVLATAMTIGHRQRCKFWKTFLQKVSFIQMTMPANSSQVLEPCGFLSCNIRSSFPEQGVTCHIFLHSAEVHYFIHKGPRPCCITRLKFLSTPWVWGPIVGPNHSPCFSAHRMPTHYFIAG